MNDMPESLKNFIRFMSPGYMIYNFLLEPNEKEEDATITFIIKEEQWRLNMLKSKVSLHLISLGVTIDNVLVIDVLIRFKDITDTIYECTINAKSKDFGELAISSLAHKDKYYIILVNEHNEVCRKIVVNNTGKKQFQEFEYKLTEWLKWSMDQFDIAKLKFNERFSDVFKLWDEISNRNTR